MRGWAARELGVKGWEAWELGVRVGGTRAGREGVDAKGVARGTDGHLADVEEMS